MILYVSLCTVELKLKWNAKHSSCLQRLPYQLWTPLEMHSCSSNAELWDGKYAPRLGTTQLTVLRLLLCFFSRDYPKIAKILWKESKQWALNPFSMIMWSGEIGMIGVLENSKELDLCCMATANSPAVPLAAHVFASHLTYVEMNEPHLGRILCEMLLLAYSL